MACARIHKTIPSINRLNREKTYNYDCAVFYAHGRSVHEMPD